MPMQPRELRVVSASRVVEVLWEDGARDRYPFSVLRVRCQCAECRSAVLRGVQLSAADVLVTDVVVIGNYAIQIFFSDGHNRGIYPYAYLRNLKKLLEDCEAGFDDVLATCQKGKEHGPKH